MKLKNPQEHISCYYYGCPGKPIIEICSMEQGQQQKLTLTSNKIVFVLEGCVAFTLNDYSSKTVEKGSFFFISSGGNLLYKASEKSLVLIIRLEKKVFLCEGCRIERLFAEKQPTAENPSSFDLGINALKTNEALAYFVTGLIDNISGGLLCRYYADVKINELFLLIRAFYSRDELRRLFSLILSPDTCFSEYIRENYHKYKTVGELADSLYMTQKNFARKFMTVFGEPPSQWIKKRKAQRIRSELFMHDKTFSQIADEYGFSNLPSFNRFCKRELGQNPGEIRDGQKR